MSAWDPDTGASLLEDDLAALIGAAQAVGDAPTDEMTDVAYTGDSMSEIPQVSAVGITLVVHCTMADGRRDKFVSHDKHMTASRVVSYLGSIPENDGVSNVRIDCCSMSAVVCRNINRSGFLTSWMDKAVAAEFGTEPGLVTMSAEQISSWALSIVTMFESASNRAGATALAYAKWEARKQAKEADADNAARRAACGGAAASRVYAGQGVISSACPSGVW